MKPSRRFATALFYAWLGIAGHPLGAKEITPVELGMRYCDFALNPETGDVAAIDPKTNSVTLFRASFLEGKDRAKTEPVKVGNLPVSLVYKKYKTRGVFVVGCRDESNLYLLDAKDLTLLRKIPLGKSEVSLVAASLNADDPYVYYSFGHGFDGGIGRASLAKLVDGGRVMGDAEPFAISASGKILYHGDSEMLEIRTDENGQDRFDYRRVDVSRDGSFTPDPLDFYTAVGPDIYTANLERKVATVSFPVEGFIPQRAMIFGLGNNELCFASYNTFHDSAKVKLPKGFTTTPWQLAEDIEEDQAPRTGRRGEADRTTYVLRALVDVARDRLLIAHEAKLAVVSLADAGLPTEPLLRVTTGASATFTTGAAGKLKLNKADPRVKIEFADLPMGLAFDGDALVWRPTEHQVGRYPLAATLRHGELTSQQDLAVEVVSPAAVLPFVAGDMALSPDEKTAICWQADGPPYRFREPEEKRDETTRLAVVDLANLRFVSEVRLPFHVGAAATDGKQVVVAQYNSRHLVYFSLAEPAQQKSVAVSGNVDALQIVGNVLMARLQSSTDNDNDDERTQRRLARFRLPEMKLDVASLEESEPLRIAPNRYGEERQPPLVRIRDGWLLGNIIYSADLKTPRLWLSTEQMFEARTEYNEPPRRFADRFREGRADNLTPWGMVQGADRDNGPEFEGRVVETSVVLGDVPARIFATVTHEAEKDRESAVAKYVQKLQLTANDLTTATHRDLVTLAIDGLTEARRENPMSLRMQPLAGGAAVLYGNRVYRYALAAEAVKELRTPLVFEMRQSAFLVDPQAPTKLTHTLTGAKPPLQAVLTSTRPEITIDTATAAVTIDGPKLLAALTKEIPFAAPDFGRGEAPQAQISQYRTATTPLFEKLAGHKPKGIPVAVPINLRVLDDESRIAELSYLVLADLPEDQVLKAAEERTAKAAEATPAGEPSRAIDLRLKRVEGKLQSLEEKLDTITRLLEEKSKSTEK